MPGGGAGAQRGAAGQQAGWLSLSLPRHPGPRCIHSLITKPAVLLFGCILSLFFNLQHSHAAFSLRNRLRSFSKLRGSR